MNAGKILSCLGLLFLGINTAIADYLPLRADVQSDQPTVNVLRHDEGQIEFEVRLPGIDLLEGILEGKRWDRVEIPGGGYEMDLGAPEVPHFTRLLAIPARSGVRADFEALETKTISGIELMPAQGRDPTDLTQDGQPLQFDISAYSRNAFYPENEVIIGEPVIARGMRLVAVRMNPVRYNPITKELQVTHLYRITIHFEGTDLRNVTDRPLRPISRSWANLMKATMINFDELDLDIIPVGSYLIICENDSYLLNNLLPPLVDWKTRKGHAVVVQTFSPGSSNNTIKNMIQTAYNTWETPPEYVLLFGDVTGSYALPGWVVGGWMGEDQIDHPYSQLDGTDEIPDVAVGRLPAGDDTEALVMINKVLYYEKMPYITNTDWYHEGVLIAGNSASGISTVQVNRYIKTRMIWNEFTEIDTFWYWMGGSVSGTLTPAINEGVSIVNYRGCYLMENFTTSTIASLTNGRKLPFVVTITCGTGGFAGYSESLMEQFVDVGSPTNPKGAVACIGTATTYTHTRQNNTLDYGIFAGIFDEGITQAGNALNRAKIELYNTYWTHDPSSVMNFCDYAALAGDPGLEVFNRAIQFCTSNIPSTTYLGENALNLTVNETGVGPLEGALVCAYKSGELHEVALTDASGQVTLPLNLNTVGNVKVTVTKHNFYPIVDSLNVIQTDVTVGYNDHSIDDDQNGTSSGDSDGVINPAETVEIPLIFKNYGNATTATNISVTATVADEYATLDDNYETFPNLSPGNTGSSVDDLDLTIAPNCPDGHVIQVDLGVNSDQGSWNGVMNLEVVSYDMTIHSAYAFGSDTLLAPGETANFILQVSNNGHKSASSLTATGSTSSPYITINDNTANFGTVNVGSTVTCFTDPFNLTASSLTPPGYPAELTIVFTSSTGATQTEIIPIVLGPKSMSDPQGPDDYGYYCFDDTDVNYAQAPTFNWIEIDPTYGGSGGTQLAINDPSENSDMSVNVNLPFTFRYYGEETNQITVCSNGWISTWPNVSFADFRNYRIPSCVGPNGMIAAFWDDLKTWSGGYVYTYYDASHHWFIIEWSRLQTVGAPYSQELFEIILCDPLYYPTPTGDGEIIFQYSSITEVYGLSDDNPYSTVGIESPNQQDGIEIVYWNTYEDPAAAHLQAYRAYRFTTAFDYNASSYPDVVVELTYVSGSPVPAGGGNLYYNAFVENQGNVPLDFDAWVEVAYQGGPPTTILLRSFTNYQPGWQINRPNVYFPVPGSYAAGNYTMTAKVGEHPDVAWDESGFPWVKLGSDAGDGFVPWAPDGMPDPFDTIIKGTEAQVSAPTEFALFQAHPNPFNPTTALSFKLQASSFVNLSVYDIAGRKVVELVNGWRDVGQHEVTFDGSRLASGIYLYHLKAGEYEASGKMVLMK